MKFVDIMEGSKHTDIVCIIDKNDDYHLIFKFEGLFYNEIMKVDKHFGKIGRCTLDAFDTLQDFAILTLSKNERVTLAQRFFSYVYAKQEVQSNKKALIDAKPVDGNVDAEMKKVVDVKIDNLDEIDDTDVSVVSDTSDTTLFPRWRIPTITEFNKFFKKGLLPKHLNVWADGTQTFGLNSGFVEETTSFAKHFLLLTDGKNLHRVKGLFTYQEALEVATDLFINETEFNNFESTLKLIQKATYKKATGTGAVGRRRSTAKPMRSKFKTGVKYVSFHYGFGKQEQAPIDTKAFCVRAVINASQSNPVGVKIRDFECNDVGIVNARHYIDSEIRKLGLEIPLYFTQSQYAFISQYGARMYVTVTEFKSELDFDKAKFEIMDRYFDIPDNFVIAESFAKRLVVDHKPQIATDTISPAILNNLKV